jgi:kinesin family protein 3/17
MQGTDTDKGILPRAVDAIFDRISRDSLDLQVEASFLEIYNESVNDLLDPAKKNLTIHCADTVSVRDLTEERVDSAPAAMQLISRGVKNRQVGATSLNKDSSRSHSVFNIIIKARGELYGKLSIVDLAGAERSSRTGISGKAQSETNAINLSLSALNNCLEAMRKNTRVPYRDANLTKLFKDVFSGTGSLAMICNVNPSPSEYDETMQSLQYAAQAKTIKIKSKVDVKRPGTGKKAARELPLLAVMDLEKATQERDREIEKLKDEVQSLRHQLTVDAERVAAQKEADWLLVNREKDAAQDAIVEALNNKISALQLRLQEEVSRLKLRHAEEMAGKHDIDSAMLSVRIENAMRGEAERVQAELETRLADSQAQLQAQLNRTRDAQDEAAQLRASVAEVQAELDESRATVAEYDAEYDRMCGEALQSVEEMRRKMDNEKANYENQAKRTAQAMGAQAAELESQLSDCMADNGRLAGELETERAARAKLEQEVLRLKLLVANMDASSRSSMADAMGVRKRKSDEGLEKKPAKTTRTRAAKRVLSEVDDNADQENEPVPEPPKRTTRATRAAKAAAAEPKEESSPAPVRVTRATAARRKALQAAK